ncbi:MAG: helix-turn-helix domain-containing protein [Lachnospiraceae bacterium]|nr:helix-turn-helix domain-containing protein [Lachnospiraceae bacterium]
MDESYMTIKEFCERMQVSTSTVYRMIKSGQIKAIKFGRYWKIPRDIFNSIRTNR